MSGLDNNSVSKVLTVLCWVFGIISCMLGALLLIVVIAMTFEGEEDVGLLVFVGAVGLLMGAGGVALCSVPHLRKRAAFGAGMQTPQPCVAPQPRTAPAPAPAPTPTPAPTHAEATHPAPETTSQTDEVANLIVRSDDVFATLKDLVRHEQGAVTQRHHLAEMLEAAGLMAWDDAPSCEAGRLSRTHHFWIRQNPDGLSNEEYDRLVTIEAALNVNQDLGDGHWRSSIADAHPAVLRIMRSLAHQQVKPYDFAPSLGEAYPGVAFGDTPGEWLVRTSFVSAAECAVTPFRVVHDHRCCVANGLMVVELEAVRPRCMAIFTADERLRTAMARAYALRVGAFLAQQALDATDKLHTVVVNAHERGSNDTILSVSFSRGLLARMGSILESDVIDESGFPSDEAIRASFGPDGWFTPVEPFVAMDDESVVGPSRFVYPELDHRETSERLRTVTGARRFDEFGINENAGRLAARDELHMESWSNTQDAVSALVEMRNGAEDITVAEACNRTVEALLSGSLDTSDTDAVVDLFLRGTSLDRASVRADKALDDEDKQPDPEAAIRILTEALAPIEALGAYLDDDENVYRYFGSVAERICFNLHIDDHRRTVQLVPDAYYNALSTLSIAHDALGHTEEALRYADEMIRIAPASIHAVMRKVRVLEGASRVYEAADLIKGILRYASTPRDACVCHYRLAFMEWKLGREDLTVACYQRAMTWDAEMSGQAQEELDDLLAANDHLHKFTKDEVNSLLAQEGIPLGCTDRDIRRALSAAALTCDEGSFWVTRPLVGIVFNVTGDDVMMGVYRSLVNS